MEKLMLVSFLSPILMGFLVYQYRRELVLLAKNKLMNDVASYDLVMLIPSAREHFTQRATIRDTWWSVVKQNDSLTNRVLLRFLVGSHSCPYQKEDRLNQYGCEEWLPHDVPEGDLVAASEVMDTTPPAYDRNYGVAYLPFQVDHPVLLDRLGIHHKSLVNGAVVRLLDALTEKTVVEASFSEDSPGQLHQGFYYKTVETYLLPKGFEGIIVGENPLRSDGKFPCRARSVQVVVHNSSALHFSEFSEPTDTHYSDPMSWKANHVVLVSFMYHVQDKESLHDLLRTRQARLTQAGEENSATDRSLQKESQSFGDVVYVDVTDVYRNIPLKLLKGIEWLVESQNFQFMLKTDDDTYLDIPRILDNLSYLTASSNSHKLWWGRFRQNWLVERYGKWAEKVYPSPVYPQFACGSGYVLSRNLTQWIADHRHMLYIYQGEDTTMGVWLAACGPHHIDDPLWQCSSDCISDMYAMPDLEPDQIRQLWNNNKQCGDPCGCS